jgi:CheY-like chemotaxis protein
MVGILLVEDEAPVCMLLTECLADAGFEVTDCLCAEEADAGLVALGSSLRVLVTDINVGVRGWGFGFARRAREANPDLAVIYITGDSEADVATQGVEGSTVLPKPFVPIELVREVHQAVARAQVPRGAPAD